ncbi:HAMP domain-containing histidine kinase [Patescibacteria group bacterium]|nr:HAMP domain-containing histidine kinase [Patescibacteria group bacterium]MBU1885063.1 HAMP domain-containing histidine kinase [Patescibacteria group bacterium]
MFKKLIKLHQRWLTPTSSDEESARKELIFYILLLGSLYLTGTATLLVIISAGKHFLAHQEFHGAPPSLMIAIWLGLMSLYRVSRQGYPRLAASLYLTLLWLATAYTSLRWGALLHQAVLTYALIIIFAGILINSKLALIITFITSLLLLILTQLQGTGVIYYDYLWQQESPHLSNTIVICLTLSLIALFSWLANREIAIALKKAMLSKQALKIERDQLEVKVQARTQQLKESQLKQMINWQRLVDVGRIASGLFHDLRNHLTQVSLDLELQQPTKALDAVHNMSDFVHHTQERLLPQNQFQYFCPATEIKNIVRMLRYQARQKQIKIKIIKLTPDQLHGSIGAFHQIMINLLTNAIESYSSAATQSSTSSQRQIEVSLQRAKNQLLLIVKDFGAGIKPDQQSKIFKPFYTTKTKTKDNFGLGLFLVKSAVEQQFNGQIQLFSKPGQGATFTISLPVKNPA